MDDRCKVCRKEVEVHKVIVIVFQPGVITRGLKKHHFWTPLGARWIGHADITWSAVCSSAPHSHSGVGARPHLCIHERKRPTPVLKRFSLTQASLGKSSPEGSDPAVGTKARSLESDSRHSFFHIWSVQSVARISKLERFSSILRAAGTNGRRDINLSCHFSGGLTN